MAYRSTEAARWLSLLAALLVCLALAGCGKSPGTDEEKAAAAVPDVTVIKVKRAPLAGSLIVSGNLAALPNRDARLTALVPGRIGSVLVAEGDPVKAGQPLVELESSYLRDQERQAEAAAAQARANVDNARLSAERNEGLLQRGIVSRKEVEDARTQLAVNEAALRQAQAALSAARTQLARAVVTAPFAGTVVRRFLGVGEQVDGGGTQPILEVANIDTLELLGSAPASRLVGVPVGQAFSFQTPAVPGATFQARVVAVLPAVDPATNNGTVRVRIENPRRQLKLGMYCSAELPVQGNTRALVVPRQAIYPDESGAPHVYRVQGDQAEFVAVELGLQTKDEAEILSGVQEGDTVILTGGYGLPEKAKVNVH